MKQKNLKYSDKFVIRIYVKVSKEEEHYQNSTSRFWRPKTSSSSVLCRSEWRGVEQNFLTRSSKKVLHQSLSFYL